jgi:hypothetical protein
MTVNQFLFHLIFWGRLIKSLLKPDQITFRQTCCNRLAEQIVIRKSKS